MLNESAERILFAGEGALGRRIQPLPTRIIDGQPVQNPWYTVIGVSADVRNGQGLTDAPEPEMYVVPRRH